MSKVTIQKSGSKAINIERKEFEGNEYIDIRNMWRKDQASQEEWKPTRKGIFIPVDDAQEVAEAILKVLKGDN